MSRPTRMETADQLRAVARGAFVAGMGVIVVILLLIALAPPASAQRAGVCETAQEIVENITANHPEHGLVRLDGDNAETFMARWNAMPPPSDWQADELLILFHARLAIIRIAFFKDGCAMAVRPVPLGIGRLLIKGLKPAPLRKATGTNT